MSVWRAAQQAGEALPEGSRPTGKVRSGEDEHDLSKEMTE
jgi:hypothetical protein